MKTKLLMRATRAACKSAKKLKKALPTIFTVVAAAGVVGTAVAAGVATPKAVEKVKEDSKEKHDGDENAYTKKEAVVSAAPIYAKAAVVGCATIGFIIGSDILNKKQLKEITVAYAGLAASYKAYKAKAKELYGENADTDISNAMARDKAKEEGLSAPKDEGMFLFYDELYYDPSINDGVGRYFERTREEVDRALYLVNREMATCGYATINDFYKYLDLKPTPDGDAIGWSVYEGEADYGIPWIDIVFEEVEVAEGLIVYNLAYCYAPTTSFLDG